MSQRAACQAATEQILDILKELTFAGQLVFAVLHQPSSDFFKMLDKLFLLDVGGHPIYLGNPLDAVQHFNAPGQPRSFGPMNANAALWKRESEQLFDIVEAQTVDEYGRKTQTRRTSPKEWNDFYTIMLGNTLPPAPQRSQPVKRASKVANGLGQWLTYLKRHPCQSAQFPVFAGQRIGSAPALALLLAGFMRDSQHLELCRLHIQGEREHSAVSVHFRHCGAVSWTERQCGRNPARPKLA